MDRTKKTLITLLVIGALATIGAGTYATFTAQTTNSANTFATGTIVLKDGTGGSACFSTGAGTDTTTNVNSSCAAIVSLSGMAPGVPATPTAWQVSNDGSLDGATLSLLPGTCSSANNATDTYHGTGTICTVLDIYIQEVDNTGANVSCLYPAGAGACAFNDANTVSTLTTNPISGGLKKKGTAGTGSGATWVGGDTRYFKIGLQLQGGAGNTYQGRLATFDLTWNLSQ